MEGQNTFMIVSLSGVGVVTVSAGRSLRELACKSFLGVLFISGFAVAQEQAEPAGTSEPAQAPLESTAAEEPAVVPTQKAAPPKNLKRKSASAAAQTPSPFLPNWTPAPFSLELRPVIGLAYDKDVSSDTYFAQGELGLHLGLRGLPLVAGNPGMAIEPSAGYAVGKAFTGKMNGTFDSGNYRRTWWGVRTPIYYKFIRQVFGVEFGEIAGGPLPASKRQGFHSDTGVALIPHISAHYTYSYDKAYGNSPLIPEVNTYDHWLHGRLSGNKFNFFIDAGPGYSVSESSGYRSSGAYLLGLSGFDLLGDLLGFEASAKYMFSSQTDSLFRPNTLRSPMEDLGAAPALVGLPADSLNASAFFGVRRILGGLGVGWRYSLEILNYSEANNTKQQKRESNGLGVYASIRF